MATVGFGIVVFALHFRRRDRQTRRPYIFSYYEGKRLVFATNLRNGFVPHLRREVASKFEELEIDTCTFANLPERTSRL